MRMADQIFELHVRVALHQAWLRTGDPDLRLKQAKEAIVRTRLALHLPAFPGQAQILVIDTDGCVGLGTTCPSLRLKLWPDEG